MFSKTRNHRNSFESGKRLWSRLFYEGRIDRTAQRLVLKFNDQQCTLPECLNVVEYQKMFYSMKEYFYAYLEIELEYKNLYKDLPMYRKMDFTFYKNKLNDKFELPYYLGINQPGSFERKHFSDLIKGSLSSLFEKFINNVKMYSIEEQRELIEETVVAADDIEVALKDLSFVVSQNVNSWYSSSPLSKMTEFLNLPEYSSLKAIMGFEKEQIVRQRDIRCFAVNGHPLYQIPIQEQNAVDKKLKQYFVDLIKKYK